MVTLRLHRHQPVARHGIRRSHLVGFDRRQANDDDYHPTGILGVPVLIAALSGAAFWIIAAVILIGFFN